MLYVVSEDIEKYLKVLYLFVYLIFEDFEDFDKYYSALVLIDLDELLKFT
jgi:hypothetical protein